VGATEMPGRGGLNGPKSRIFVGGPFRIGVVLKGLPVRALVYSLLLRGKGAWSRHAWRADTKGTNALRGPAPVREGEGARRRTDPVPSSAASGWASAQAAVLRARRAKPPFPVSL
jgi:hypothetical protein